MVVVEGDGAVLWCGQRYRTFSCTLTHRSSIGSGTRPDDTQPPNLHERMCKHLPAGTSPCARDSRDSEWACSGLMCMNSKNQQRLQIASKVQIFIRKSHLEIKKVRDLQA